MVHSPLLDTLHWVTRSWYVVALQSSAREWSERVCSLHSVSSSTFFSSSGSSEHPDSTGLETLDAVEALDALEAVGTVDGVSRSVSAMVVAQSVLSEVLLKGRGFLDGAMVIGAVVGAGVCTVSSSASRMARI